MNTRWGKLGRGHYNHVYCNEDETKVFKCQVAIDGFNLGVHVLSDPTRSVELWNMINPDFPAQVSVEQVPDRGWQYGWTCPFIKGRQSSDEEMAKAVIKIFNDTGRVIVDAVSPRNFLTTDSGRVVCVDIDFALQMERIKSDAPYGSINPRRRCSYASLSVWSGSQFKFIEHFSKGKKYAPQTIETIKALLFIKAHRPAIERVDFLKKEIKDGEIMVRVAEILSSAFDAEFREKHKIEAMIPDEQIRQGESLLEKMPINYEVKEEEMPEQRAHIQVKEILENQRPARCLTSIDDVKESCIEALKEYLCSMERMRIKVGPEGWGMRFFSGRNLDMLANELAPILGLMNTLSQKSCSSFKEIEEAILAVSERFGPFLLFPQGLKIAFENCQFFLALAEYQDSMRAVSLFKP